MQNLLNKIHLGDCLAFMKQLPDKCIDLVLTDPPYGISADKGTNGFGTVDVRKYSGGWDKSVPEKEYFDNILRVSKRQLIFGGNYFTDKLPVSKTWLVWDKVGEYHFNNPFADIELIWSNLTSASKKYTCVQQGFVSADTEKRIHPTQKPLPLLVRLLEEYAKPGMVIFDPFSGSGTTAIACHKLGLDFICVERDPDYHAASVARLAKEREQGQLNLFPAQKVAQGLLFE